MNRLCQFVLFLSLVAAPGASSAGLLVDLSKYPADFSLVLNPNVPVRNTAMNRDAKGERHFDASDASNASAAEPVTRFPPFSPTQLASFFGPISTNC